MNAPGGAGGRTPKLTTLPTPERGLARASTHRAPPSAMRTIINAKAPPCTKHLEAHKRGGGGRERARQSGMGLRWRDARHDGIMTGTCAHGQHGRRLTGRGGAHGVGTLGEMLRRGRRGLRQGNPDRGRLRPHAGGQGAGEGRERREEDCTLGRGATSIARGVCANRLNGLRKPSE